MDRVEAIGGINIDPYVNEPRVGRLRHVYVRAEQRNAGVGTRLVQAILGAAAGSFDQIRLRAASSRSESFYARLGFRRVLGDPSATHVRDERAELH